MSTSACGLPDCKIYWQRPMYSLIVLMSFQNGKLSLIVDEKLSLGLNGLENGLQPIPDHEEKGGSTSFVDAIQKKDASPAVLGI